MNAFVRRAFLLATLALLNPVILDAAENASGDLQTVYEQAMTEFQAGNYANAATQLEALAARVEASPEAEAIFYSSGCAWFNAGDHSKAITAFKNYQARFPKGAHAGAVAFAIAQSNLQSKNYEEAGAQLAALENDPAFRVQALISKAEAYKAAGKTVEAIGALEKLVGTGMTTAEAVRGGIMLAQLHAERGDGARALHTLELIHEKVGLVENIVELNSLAVDLGDEFYKKQQFTDALACYRFARPREEIILRQKEHIAAIQRQAEDTLAAARARRSEITQLASRNSELKEKISKAQKVLADFEKLPSITPAIYLRLGRCFYELGRKWESIVVNQEILDRFHGGAEEEPALFGLIVALSEVNQPTRAEELCQQYLRDFKDGPNSATVGYLLGAVALQAGNTSAAEQHFREILETQPETKFREQIRYLLGNAKFAAANYNEAASAYRVYLSEFPDGPNVEDVKYRVILCALFAGKYQEAMKQFRDYLAEHASSTFVPDAKYRLAVCKYAASLYPEVIADCQSWEKQFPNNPQLGEVLALHADAYAASGGENDAIPVYIRSYQAATTDEVLNYSLLAASKLLQKQNDWNKVAELFAAFIRDKPDHPTAVSAIYWIGKAKAHDGKIDEAKQLGAETIKKHISDPTRDTVEQLITQLAQLCLKPKVTSRANNIGNEQENAAERASATPVAGSDPGAELEVLLASEGNEGSSTARARTLFAKAELARLRREPGEEQNYIGQLANGFKPEDLSPLLLGKAGDYLVEKGKYDQAAAFYQWLLNNFPKKPGDRLRLQRPG